MERPLTPAEALENSTTVYFLQLKLEINWNSKRYWKRKKEGMPVNLVYTDGQVVAKPILDGSADLSFLILIYQIKRICLVIYEHPLPNAPKYSYR